MPHHIRRAIAACSILCLSATAPASLLGLAASVGASATASAADLDQPYAQRPSRRAEVWAQDHGEFIPAHHGCRLIPQPELNMWGEASIYQPAWVCVSRGLYADTFPPPPPPRPQFFGLW